ncbi:hypothetical protein BB559_003080 [Furculomyces boomerangus]|uniref:C2H2-type domain-containing protein n=2 Tax=Harpellales TaxID=61421 RepID=A0A2T9YPD6_9FUNG|nr:hypothetical protein BB559_003080 [Furculomyces boomerangus]PVZ96667.1 hypothetical protein BB558_007415 [Smittium angustum]
MSFTDDVSKRMNDFVSDEDSHEFRRQKYHRERESPERYTEREVDRFGRDKRSRSPSENDFGRSRSRSPRSRPDRFSERRDGGYRNEGRGSRFRGRMSGDSGSRHGQYRSNGYSRGDNDSFYDDGRKDFGRSPDSRHNRNKLADPRSFDLVVPFRYFCEWKKSQKDGDKIEQEELRTMYEEYRREALNKLFEMFFVAHKDEDWFIEHYKPDVRLERTEKMNMIKIPLYQAFLSKINNGEFDDLSLDQPENTENSNNAEDKKPSDNQESDADKPIEETRVLFIRTIPPSVSRSALEAEISKSTGFEYLSFSEPNMSKNFHRFGWIKFKEGTDMDVALESLKNLRIEEFQFHISHHAANSTAQTRTAPEVSNTPARIHSDLLNIRKALKVFDERTKNPTFAISDVISEKMKSLTEKIKSDYELNNPAGSKEDKMQTDESVDQLDTTSPKEDINSGSKDLGSSAEKDEKTFTELEVLIMKKELDLSIEYLRNVHFYCYYCGNVSENPEDFSRKCATHHYRRVPSQPLSSSTQTNFNWTRTNDTRNKAIIETPDISEIHKQGGKLYEEADIEFFKDLIKPKDKGRYRCMVCEKLFKGETFIRRHILNKHSGLVDNSLMSEVDFFNNFVLDAPSYLPLGAGQVLNSSNNQNFGGMTGNQSYGFMPQYIGGDNSQNMGQFQQGPGMMNRMMNPYQMMMGPVGGGHHNAPMMMPFSPYNNNFGFGVGQMGGIPGHPRGFGGNRVPYMGPNMMGWPHPVMPPFAGPSGMGSGPMNNGFNGGNMGNAFMQSPPKQQEEFIGNQRQDPRAVRSYVDLDAPGDEEPDYGF